MRRRNFVRHSVTAIVPAETQKISFVEKSIGFTPYNLLSKSLFDPR